MPTRKPVQAPERVLLPPEKAISLLTQQLAELQRLKGRGCSEAKEDEDQWQHLTAQVIWQAFHHSSANHLRFQNAKNAGDHTMRSDFPGTYRGPSREQPNFEARIRAFESLLKTIIKELEMFLPDTEIKGAYRPGDDYEFYKDLKTIIGTARRSLFIIDNYLDVEIFDLYVERVQAGVNIRILTDQLRVAVQSVATKFSKRGQFELRTSGGAAHDRHLFVDDRGWVIGQSIKDAALKKPTYMVELNDVTTFRNIYEPIWLTATTIIRS
ncbi:MAG: hypothetical protein ABSH47_24940 [Bryobacteraceae bacterium]|jgi:hypothetical protein